MKANLVYIPDKARSLTARANGSPCIDRGPEIIAAGFKAGNGAAASIGYEVEKAATLCAGGSGIEPTVAVYDMTHADEVMRRVKDGLSPTLMGVDKDIAFTLNTVDRHAICCKKNVRRLTPTECERLQGLPDNYTLIDDKSCSDTARYKALGNGMAQPLADWVIKRIVEEWK